MPELHNHSKQPITASTGHSVPAGGSLPVSDATWTRISREPYIATKIAFGALVVGNSAVANDPETHEVDDAPALLAEDIAKMRTSSVKKHLAENGVNPEQMEGKELDDLRVMLTAIVCGA